MMRMTEQPRRRWRHGERRQARRDAILAHLAMLPFVVAAILAVLVLVTLAWPNP